VPLVEGCSLRRSLYVTSQDEVCGQLKAKYLDVPQVDVAIDGELNRDTEPTLWGIIRIDYSMMREDCLASNGKPQPGTCTCLGFLSAYSDEGFEDAFLLSCGYAVAIILDKDCADCGAASLFEEGNLNATPSAAKSQTIAKNVIESAL
jgi:hypothetical protein